MSTNHSINSPTQTAVTKELSIHDRLSDQYDHEIDGVLDRNISWAETWQSRTQKMPSKLVTIGMWRTPLIILIGLLTWWVWQRFGNHQGRFAELVVAAGMIGWTAIAAFVWWPAVRFIVDWRFARPEDTLAVFERELENQVFTPLNGAFNSHASNLNQNARPSDVRHSLRWMDDLAETHRSVRMRLVILKGAFEDQDRLDHRDGRITSQILTNMITLVISIGVVAWLVTQLFGISPDLRVPGLTITDLIIGGIVITVAVLVELGLKRMIWRGSRDIRERITYSIEGVLARDTRSLRQAYAEVVETWADETTTFLNECVNGSINKLGGYQLTSRPANDTDHNLPRVA